MNKLKIKKIKFNSIKKILSHPGVRVCAVCVAEDLNLKQNLGPGQE